ncbi:MAG: hypothetical protein FWG97_05205 [Deltaproteobacteria bacterium]|nr:hypothetical protein [Deltaproteobacteria bacterium]
MKKISPPALLKFVRRYDPVARICDDGQTIQIVSPRLDKEGRFIRLYAAFARPGRLLLHDDAYTLNARVNLAGVELAEINTLISSYGLVPLKEPQGSLEIWVKNFDDYLPVKVNLENAILSLTSAYGRPRVRPGLTLIKAPEPRV